MNEQKCPCQFPIPLCFNDGTDVSPEKLALIFKALDQQFLGYTHLGIRMGCWEGQTEPMAWIEVDVPLSRVAELREVVYAIGKSLGQKVMYFNAPPSTVEFITIEGGPTEASAGETKMKGKTNVN